MTASEDIRSYVSEGAGRPVMSEEEATSFYKSYRWQQKRAEILTRDNYECQRCKDLGRVSRGDTVHHIKHLRVEPRFKLDDDNLITLCKTCHNLVHPEKAFEEQKSPYHGERWE